MFMREELFCSIDDLCLSFEMMLCQHPTIFDCGTNEVRWKKKLIQSGLHCRLHRRRLSQA